VTITAWLPTDPTNRYTEFFRAQVPLFQQANEKIKVNHETPGAAALLEAAVVVPPPPRFSFHPTL